MRPMPTPQEQGDNYTAAMANAGTKYAKGIMRTTESPTAKAAAKIEKMRANFNAAIDSGKTQAGLLGVTLQQWQTLAAGKGKTNLATGAAAAKQKVVNAAAAMRPAIDQLRAEIDAMPNDTPDERTQRSVAWQNGMRQISANRRR